MCVRVRFCEKAKGRVYTTSAAMVRLIFRENTKGLASPSGRKEKKERKQQPNNVYVKNTKRPVHTYRPESPSAELSRSGRDTVGRLTAC